MHAYSPLLLLLGANLCSAGFFECGAGLFSGGGATDVEKASECIPNSMDPSVYFCGGTGTSIGMPLLFPFTFPVRTPLSILLSIDLCFLVGYLPQTGMRLINCYVQFTSNPWSRSVPAPGTRQFGSYVVLIKKHLYSIAKLDIRRRFGSRNVLIWRRCLGLGSEEAREIKKIRGKLYCDVER